MFLTSTELTKAVRKFKLYKALITIGILSIIVLCLYILVFRQHDRLLTFICIGFAVACLVLISMTINPFRKQETVGLSDRVCDTNRELLVKEIPVKEDDPKVAKKWVGFIEGCNSSKVTISQLKNAKDAKWDAESVINVLGKDGIYAIEPEFGVKNSNLKTIGGIQHVRSMGRAIPLAEFNTNSINDESVAMAAVGSMLARV